jgi:hypothetical protein
MDYWSSLMDKGVELTEQREMERLNAARVNLKHRVVSRIFRTLGWLSGARPWLTR